MLAARPEPLHGAAPVPDRDVSTNGVTFTPPWLTRAQRANAFPGFNPRPVAPELILRSFSFAGPVKATPRPDRRPAQPVHGQPGVPGRAGQRPARTAPTAASGTPGSDTVGVFGDLPQVVAERDNEVHIAELQVFSSGGGAGGGGGGGGGGNAAAACGDDECDEKDDLVKLGPPVASPGRPSSTRSPSRTTATSTTTARSTTCCPTTSPTCRRPAAASTTRRRERSLGYRHDRSRSDANVTLTARVSPSAAIGSTLINRAYFGALEWMRHRRRRRRRSCSRRPALTPELGGRRRPSRFYRQVRRRCENATPSRCRRDGPIHVTPPGPAAPAS